MASLKLNIPHQLAKEDALARIKTLLTDLREQQKDKIKSVEEDWQNDTGNFRFNIQGFDLSGRIQVNNDTVDIDGDLPFALSFFKGKISDIIREKALGLLAK